MKMLVLSYAGRTDDVFSHGSRYCEMLTTRFPQTEFRFLENGKHTMEDILWCDAISGHPPREQLAQAPNIRWLHIQSAGVDGYTDRAMYANSDIIVTRTADTFGPAIAEHTLGMMLALARMFPHYARLQYEHAWNRTNSATEVRGSTVLMLGTGSLASELLPLLKPFGCKIIGVRRDISKPAAGYDRLYPADKLNDALAQADFIVNTLPHTDATHHLLGAEQIAAVKRGAYIINVGRGGTIDQNALIAALGSGHLGGAGLDVTDPEPLPSDSPLWDMDNVIITPHSSGFSEQTNGRRVELFAKLCEQYLNGEELNWQLDFEAGY